MQKITTEKWVAYKATETNVTEALIDFGVCDSKGNLVGAIIIRFEETRTRTKDRNVVPEGVYYTTPDSLGFFYSYQCKATRNGKECGNCRFGNSFRTKAERELAVEKYLKAAKNRAIKKASK
jgi:hypothetical protein